MLGLPILYCKGMRPMMFQLSGFCYTTNYDYYDDDYNSFTTTTTTTTEPRALHPY